MTSIHQLLNKEKELHQLLNSKNPPEDITQKYNELFSNSLFKKTREWFLKQFKYWTSGMHDAAINSFSQKKHINKYNISFFISHLSIYSQDSEEIGYMPNIKFNISSKDSFRDISNSCILNFIIDEANKQVGFYYILGPHRKVSVFTYDTIDLIKTDIHLYQPRTQASVIKGHP